MPIALLRPSERRVAISASWQAPDELIELTCAAGVNREQWSTALDPFALLAPKGEPPSVDLDASAGPGQQHSSAPIKRPTINWDAGVNKSLGRFDTAADDSPDWLDGFLNHLGQDQSVWNPNAGIRIQLTNSPAANLV